MNTNELKARLEQVENAIFCETMRNFMNWSRYYELQNERDELLKQLNKA